MKMVGMTRLELGKPLLNFLIRELYIVILFDSVVVYLSPFKIFDKLAQMHLCMYTHIHTHSTCAVCIYIHCHTSVQYR